jgi:hypothetical protein
MIRQIKWGSRSSDEPLSPFSGGKVTRPIRIILHSSSFDRADEYQLRAIQLLQELTKLTRAIEVIDTAPGALPYLEFEDCNRDGSTIPITVKDGKNWKIKSGIRAPENLFNAFASSVEKSRSEGFDRQSAYQDFLVARANYELGYDVLITLSPCLLGNRESPWIRSVNIRSPLEAVKMIGLLLRTRGGYRFEAMPNYFLELDRRSIYKELLQGKLPSIPRYIKACAHAEALGATGITYLAESALVRCTRALQARDEIGALFYMPQSNESRDAIMYHFDYLALLLVGAFDAQARVARRAYGINRPNEMATGFRRKEFLKALKGSSATALYNLVSEQHFGDLMDLIHLIRNSIHGSVWPTIASKNYRDLEESFIKVPPPYKDKIWQAALRRVSADNWGLIQDNDFSMLLLEPYSYAVNLVDECYRQIDEIAILTDFTRLLPPDFDMSHHREMPSYDQNYVEFVRQRVELLD